MEVRNEKKGDVVVLAPVGRLDTKTAGEFEKAVVETLQAGEKRFVIDLGELEYVSSAGLRVLLMLAKKLPGMDGALALCRMSDHVKQVFDIAGFSGVFTIVATEPEAIKALKKDPRKDKIPVIAAKLFALGDDFEDRFKPSHELPVNPEAAEIAALAANLFGVRAEPAQRGGQRTSPKTAYGIPLPVPVPDVKQASAEAKKDNPWTLKKFLGWSKNE